MDKIKVLHFPIANARGGITQYVLNNWKFIDRKRFKFDFATLSNKLDFEEKLIRQRSKVHYISCYAEENKEQFTKEIINILSEGYDVIHLHTSYWKSFIVEELAMEYKIPKIIVHSHSTMVDIADRMKRQEAVKIHNLRKKQFSTSLATDFCACSKMAMNWLYGNQIPKDKVKILNNAIDVEEFTYNKNFRIKYRKDLGLEGCLVLGHIGRFVYTKNHDKLIDIFNIVCRNITNAKLMLVGTGALEENIRKKVKLYGLEDKVLFLGKRSDVNYLMQAMDLFLLPSIFEGLPIVLIEAQAAGLKCIVSTNITNEVRITNNIQFVPLDIYQWADKINEISNDYYRTNMEGIITKAGYNITYSIKELEQLYSV